MLDGLFSPLDVACYDTVHDHRCPRTGRRGAVALADQVDIPAGVLSNKVNPNMPDSELRLKESIRVQLIADDFRIAYAYNAALGLCAWRLPIGGNGSDVEVLDAYAAENEALGLKASAIREALKDGRVTREEVDLIKRRFDESVRAGLELLQRMQALVG